jgi:hypothetical protein
MVDLCDDATGIPEKEASYDEVQRSSEKRRNSMLKRECVVIIYDLWNNRNGIAVPVHLMIA